MFQSNAEPLAQVCPPFAKFPFISLKFRMKDLIMLEYCRRGPDYGGQGSDPSRSFDNIFEAHTVPYIPVYGNIQRRDHLISRPALEMEHSPAQAPSLTTSRFSAPVHLAKLPFSLSPTRNRQQRRTQKSHLQDSDLRDRFYDSLNQSVAKPNGQFVMDYVIDMARRGDVPSWSLCIAC